MDNELLKDTVLKLKDRIIKTEAGNIQLSETDTRQGLINPLFRALQWDFGDFESIKSELRVPKFNEPVDYAFYSSKKKTDTPILLLEERLGEHSVPGPRASPVRRAAAACCGPLCAAAAPSPKLPIIPALDT